MQSFSSNLTDQQKRFCDEYLVNFNAFRAAMNAGYSENTARKGELLHMPKIQDYLKAAMNQTASRLQITHDMILRELAKVAFANMGNYYDDRGVLKPINELTADEKAAINQYQVLDAVDGEGQRVGELSKIKLHNKMAALDKIARHLNFYGNAEKKQNTQAPPAESETVTNNPLPLKSPTHNNTDDNLYQDVNPVSKPVLPFRMDYPIQSKILTLSPLLKRADTWGSKSVHNQHTGWRSQQDYKNTNACLNI